MTDTVLGGLLGIFVFLLIVALIDVYSGPK